EAIAENANDTQEDDSQPSGRPPTSTSRLLTGLTPFWHDRVIEVALVLSMALYYVTGNTNLGAGRLFHLNPLISLPFLLIFAVLVSFAVCRSIDTPESSILFATENND